MMQPRTDRKQVCSMITSIITKTKYLVQLRTWHCNEAVLIPHKLASHARRVPCLLQAQLALENTVLVYCIPRFKSHNSIVSTPSQPPQAPKPVLSYVSTCVLILAQSSPSQNKSSSSQNPVIRDVFDICTMKNPSCELDSK